MKILIFSQYWAPENGVPQRRWSWLSEVLIGAGHDVFVVAPPPHYMQPISMSRWRESREFRTKPYFQKRENGESILRTGFIPAGRSLTSRVVNQASVALAQIATIIRHRKVLAETEADLIIGTVPALPTSFVTWFASSWLGVPYIIDLRDAWPDLLKDWDKWNREVGAKSWREQIYSRGLVQAGTWLVRRIVTRTLRNASGIICTSVYLEKSLQKRFSNGKNGRMQTVTVRNVFPSESVVARGSNEYQPCEGGVLHVLYAGTIGRAQALTNALEAVRIANAETIKVQLRVVGDGAAREALADKAEKENLAVEFFQRTAAEDLLEHYSWADTALVHLADWEPLKMAIPSKLFELMRAGIHISGVVQGEAAELICSKEAGFATSPGDPQQLADSWLSLVTTPQKLRVSDKGRSWVEEEMKIRAPHELLQFLDQLTGVENEGV